jgi:amino acid adenylation domain-containing protein
LSEAVKTTPELSREEKLALVARLARQKERAARSFPLSFAQQRLWFLDRLEPGNYSHNVFRALTWSGPLDVEALRRALSEVVRRHEALRTVFPEIGGEPRQKVVSTAGAAELPLPVEAVEDPAHARRVAEEESRHPFDLAAGPVFRARLLRVAAEEHVLLLTIHHIAFDGWSMGLLYRELTALYRAFSSGLPSPLPEPAAQYPDFAAWQRERLTDERLAGELAWWRERLDGYPGYLELPADRGRPAGGSFRGAIEPFVLGPELSEAVRALARREGATPFMVLLAAFHLLLFRITEQGAFLVGTNVAGRNRTELEGVIGFFSEILLLRARVDRDTPFRDLLDWVRRDTLDAQAHQELPFERLVEELQPERHLSHNPLYQVLFVFQNVPGGTVELPGLRIGSLPLERNLAKLDLTLDMVERGGGFAGFFEYNTDLFDRETVVRLSGCFVQLLQGIVADPGRPAGELPLLTAQERRRTLVDWNRRFGGSPKLVPERIAEQARRAPDAPAVVFGDIGGDIGDGVLTYAELAAGSNRIARALRRLGVGLDTPVGVCLERSLAMPMALLGVLKSGGAWVPLDPAYPKERLAVIVEDTRMPALLTTRGLAADIPSGDARVVCLEDLDAEDASDPGWEIVPEALAYVIYTSGSTGRPKGVGVPHFSLANHASACAGRYGLRPEDRALQFTSISFDITSEEIFPTWITGGAVVPRPPGLFPSFDELHGMIERHGITVANLPTAYWHEWVGELLHTGGRPPKPLRMVVVGTEQALPERVAEWLEVAPGVAWINGYASTEATVTALTYEPGPADANRLRSAQRVPVGKPIANCRVYVLDAAMEPVPIGVHGDVYIGGPNVSRGYLGWPDRTAASFLPDPFAEEMGYGPGQRLYRQGDRGRYLPDGTVECLGRSDFQVKIRGFRIEPGEIEAALARHPAVRECVVLVQEDAPGSRRLVAYSALDRPATPEELRAFLRESLPDHMVPPAFVVLEALPLNVNGKVDRRALARLAPAPEPATAQEAPRNPFEEVVAAVWAELLRRDRVGLHESFFDLGGHSLLATQLVARLREAFGVDLPLRTVFEEPTVAGLAAAVEAVRRSAEGLLSPPVVRVPRQAAMPCSFAQQRLWILDQLTPGSPAYNMPLALRLQGRLDLAALGRALDEIVRRHESLRTTFSVAAGQPVQVIGGPAPVDLPVTDLSRAEDPAAEAGRRIEEEARRPFSLAGEPLLRCSLLRLAAADHLLMVTMHHIVSDGWSLNVFLRELSALYGGSLLPELPVQYADYAAWQRGWLQGELLERQLATWRECLGGAAAALDLPVDRPRPPVQTSRGGRQAVEVDAGTAGGLQALARARRATPFMVLLAGFQALLSRLSGQDDVLVGTPVAGRTRREVEGLIGFFANTLVLRADLSGTPAFSALVSHVRERALEAYTHQDVPFERLVEELRPERHLSHNPIFQVLFALHHDSGAPLALPGLTASLPLVDNRTSRFDLALSLSETGGGLRGHLVYNADLFDAGTAERFARHLERLLVAAAAQPDTPAADLPLLSEAERRQLVETWNGTAAEIPAATVQELIERAAARYPDRPALVGEGGETLTYAELNARAHRLAHCLRRLGVGPGSLVALHLERSPEMVVSLLGVLKAGGAYLPLDPSHPRERLDWILQDSGAALVIADPGSEVAGMGLPRIDAGGMEEAPPAGALEPLAGPEDIAYVLYTSGSTGRPKGVEVRHRGMVNFLASMAREPGLGAADTLVAVTTVSFDIAGLELWLPLCVGARVVLASRDTAADGVRLARLLEERGATALQATPATWRILLAAGWNGSPGLTALCGGEALPAEMAAALLPRVAALWNVYGPTETTVWSTLRRVDGAGDTVSGTVPIGRPIANTAAHVLDRRLEPVPVGVAGELYLGGEGLARGYLRRPDLTAERFVPDPLAGSGGRLYRTGDLARRLPSGELAFLGRADNQVKLRGFRIEPGEVESALERLPAVRQAVAGVVDGQLVAWLVPARETPPTVAELREALRRELPDYMIPGVFVPLGAFPLTPSGKVDRKSLLGLPGLARAGQGGEFAPPQGPVEETLAAIWADVLRIERVGTRDNFFELGGHSLMATQVLARVREIFGFELPLRDMFEHPTLAGLAERIVLKELESADAGLLARMLAQIEGQTV